MKWWALIGVGSVVTEHVVAAKRRRELWSKGEQWAHCKKNTTEPKLLRFFPQETISYATPRGTWKQFTVLLTFFLIPRVWETARAGFSKDGKSGSSKCTTKAARCPLKWTITNGADMLLGKMNEASQERQSCSNKSLRLSRTVILTDSLALHNKAYYPTCTHTN